MNTYRINMDNMIGINCCQFRLLTWTSIMGQFVNPVGGGGDGVKGVDEGSSFYPATSFTLVEFMII